MVIILSRPQCVNPFGSEAGIHKVNLLHIPDDLQKQPLWRLQRRWSLFMLACTWHDDVIKRKHFPRYWPFVRGIHRSPVNSPHKGQWRWALMFSLICVCIKGWVNDREAGDLKRYHAHYDVTVMWARWMKKKTSQNSFVDNKPIFTIEISHPNNLFLKKMLHRLHCKVIAKIFIGLAVSTMAPILWQDAATDFVSSNVTQDCFLQKEARVCVSNAFVLEDSMYE